VNDTPITVANVRTQISDRPQIWPPMAQPPETIGIGDGVTLIFSLRFENYIPNTLTVSLATPSTGAPPTWTALNAAAYTVGAPSSGIDNTAATNAIVTFNPVATTANNAVSATGSATITPASMIGIYAGSLLTYDTGGSQEAVTVTAVTATTFTAVFAHTHSAGVAIAGSGAPVAGTLVGSRCQVTAFSDTDLAAYLTRAQCNYTDPTLILKRVQFDLIDVVQMDNDRLLILSEGDYRKDPQAYAESLRQLKAELRLDLEGGPQQGANVPAMSIGTSQLRTNYQPFR
jgi:hypothetical protein